MRLEAFGAHLNTNRGFGLSICVFLPFEGLYMQYDDNKDTITKIQAFGLIWVHIEALSYVLGRLYPLGTSLCMQRYDKIYEINEMTLYWSKCGSSGHDITQIICYCTICISSGYDNIISLITWLVTVSKLSILCHGLIWFSLVLRIILCLILMTVIWFKFL